MSDREQENTELERFFAAAKEREPKPGPDLVAKVLADAAALQPKAAASSGKRARQGWFKAFGGWPALAGLATATVAGVTIGLADPATVGELAFYGVSDGYDFSGLGNGFELGFEDG